MMCLGEAFSMVFSTKRIFQHILVFLTVLLASGCTLMPTTTTASFANDFNITYKSTDYTTFIGFLNGYLGQITDYQRPQLGGGTASHPQFSATEVILLNGEPVLHEYTFLSSIADPYNGALMVPFYERYQSYYPALSPYEFYIAMIVSPEPVTEYNTLTYFRLQDFNFYTGTDGLGNFNGQYGAGSFWYNPIIENMTYNIGNASIIDPVNSTVLKNFQVISQSNGSFEATFDVVSWRLGYFDYNLTAAQLIDQTDFTSTVTLHFVFDATTDKLTITYDPGTKFILPFANQYTPTVSDDILVTIEYRIGNVDWTTFEGVKTFTAEELSPLMRQAWTSWGGLGTFLK
jgi:hypothetical protein